MVVGKAVEVAVLAGVCVFVGRGIGVLDGVEVEVPVTSAVFVGT